MEKLLKSYWFIIPSIIVTVFYVGTNVQQTHANTLDIETLQQQNLSYQQGVTDMRTDIAVIKNDTATMKEDIKFIKSKY